MDDFHAIIMVATSIYSLITFVNIFFNECKIVLNQCGGFYTSEDLKWDAL